MTVYTTTTKETKIKILLLIRSICHLLCYLHASDVVFFGDRSTQAYRPHCRQAARMCHDGSALAEIHFILVKLRGSCPARLTVPKTRWASLSIKADRNQTSNWKTKLGNCCEKSACVRYRGCAQAGFVFVRCQAAGENSCWSIYWGSAHRCYKPGLTGCTSSCFTNVFFFLILIL